MRTDSTVPNKMKYSLRTKPTQFTRGKTEETLCDIYQRISERNLINDNENDTNTHLIDIVVTNNSLVETQQWRYRMDEKFKGLKNIKINILSSKSKDHRAIDSYINEILVCDDKNKLPNILIMCFHSKRVCDDAIRLLKTFNRPLWRLPNTTLQFHISLDEPDANIGVTKKFLKKVKPFIKKDVVLGVLFITATPVDKFWKMLYKSGISKLLNMNADNTNNFDKDLEDYRSFKDHKIIEHNNETSNPLEYICDLFSKKKINDSERKIIFAPGHIYTVKEGVGSHLEISNFFLEKDYTVLLMNGKFKGFKYPDGSKITLEDYNIKHNIKGELRNTLQFWSEHNKTTNLAIVGYWVIERGVTFNTTNFNFTDMIISNFHLKEIDKLIQLVGRGSGGNKYVEKMEVFCTTKIKETIVKFNENFNQICSLNPEYFNRNDFSRKQNAIPVKMYIQSKKLFKKIIALRTTSKKGYRKQFHNMIKNGIQEKTIMLWDHNNIHKFDISSRTLNQVRMYKAGDKIEVRRFKQFHEAYDKNKSVAQQGDSTQYNIDFAKDEYKFKNYTAIPRVAWITFHI